LEKFQSHWDGPQYSIALFRYSIADNTPAAPGYPIYIGIGKVFNIFVDNPHFALTIESAVFNAIGSVIVYLFAKSVFNKQVGLIAAVFYITSPVIYFFGLTAYAYGVDVVFYLLFAFSCYYLIVKKKDLGMLTGITCSLLIGFRPQDLIFVLPLFLFAFFRSKKKEKVKLLISFALVSFLWATPVILVTGGILPYIHHLEDAISSMKNISDRSYFDVNRTLLKGLVLTLGLSIVFPPLFLATNHFKIKKKKYRQLFFFFLVWIAPPLFFNVLVRSDHAGYQLPYLVPLLFLCSACLYSLFRKSYYLKVFLIAVVIVNFILFFRNRDMDSKERYIPTSFHYSEIVKNDRKMEEKISYIVDNFNPSTTLILVGGADYFRPIMYYFPNFRVVQINSLTSNDSYFERFIREGYQYKMKEYSVNKSYYQLPRFISTVVCFDDECKKWLKDNSHRIDLDESTSMTVIETGKSRIGYSYGRLVVN